MPDKVSSKPKPTGGRGATLLADGFKLVTTYTYADADGTPRYYVDRYEKYGDDGKRVGKEFVQRTDDAENIRGIGRLLYNLPNVVAADEVFLVEGEKDADTLNALGFVATTTNNGCGGWLPEYADWLKGKHIVVLADNDEDGQEGANERAASLAHVCASVKVITVSALPKGDVTDWMEQEGGTAEKLREIVASTETFKDPADETISTSADDRTTDATDAPSPWPDRILHPSELVGRLADYITATAASPQPLFSLGASLATFGALLGRGVKDVTGQYTNLYAFSLGYSNGGKNDPKRTCIQLFDQLQRGKVVVEKVCSDSAEEILLTDFPVMFHVLDEVGHYFGSMKTAGQNNPHLKTVLPMFTDLWSAPTRDGIFTGKGRCPQTGKSWKPPVKIPIPAVAIYATGSPDRLFDALSFDDLTDGAITHYLCFMSETFPDIQIHPSAPFPADLLEDISNALDALGLTADKYLQDGVKPEP